MLSYAIINGLKSHISAYVTQQKANDLGSDARGERILMIVIEITTIRITSTYN